MKTTWKTDWGTFEKGQAFRYYSEALSEFVTDKINYVTQNKFYSVFVLENGEEIVEHSKLWYKLNVQKDNDDERKAFDDLATHNERFSYDDDY